MNEVTNEKLTWILEMQWRTRQKSGDIWIVCRERKKKQFKNDEKDKNEEVKKAGEAGKNVFLNAKTHELTQGKPR